MNTIEEDSVYLKNVALMELVGQHVIVGWDRDHKWNAGELSVATQLDDECDHDAAMRKPILWKLDLGGVRAGNRVRGYELVRETYFVTTDLMWWAPATPKEEKAR